jgi:hypothetical protein
MQFYSHGDAYTEYMTLLGQLKELIRRDLDESIEGEQLRAKMDKLWFEIPEEKRREINKDVSLPNIDFK